METHNLLTSTRTQMDTVGRQRSLDVDVITSCSLDEADENPCSIRIILGSAHTPYINLILPPPWDTSNMQAWNNTHVLTWNIYPGAWQMLHLD